MTFKGKPKSGVCTHSSRIRLSLLIRRTNVAWLYGEGQEDVVNGFEIREASSEEWTRVDQDIVLRME